jgi:hypothetical protein
MVLGESGPRGIAKDGPRGIVNVYLRQISYTVYVSSLLYLTNV